jgi:hypothetical protein
MSHSLKYVKMSENRRNMSNMINENSTDKYLSKRLDTNFQVNPTKKMKNMSKCSLKGSDNQLYFILYLRGWSENFSAWNIDGNNIGKIFSITWYVCHKHACETASHSIK